MKPEFTKHSPKIWTIALLLFAFAIAPNTFADDGLRYYGWEEFGCSGETVAKVSELKYFSWHIEYYIDAENPGAGCQAL